MSNPTGIEGPVRRFRVPLSSRRLLAVALTAAGCLPIALIALWLLPWPYWPFVLLLLGCAVWGASVLTVLIEEDRERKLSHGLVDGFARLRGAEGTAMTDLTPGGVVKVAGEVWSARSADERALRRRATVRVVGAHDFELLVEVVPDDAEPAHDDRVGPTDVQDPTAQGEPSLPRRRTP